MASYVPQPKRQELVIMKGLPASGKTTEVKRLMDLYPMTFQRVSKDDLRAMINFEGYSPGKENLVRSLRDATIRHYLDNGWSVIVDDTNLNPEHEKQLREIATPFFSVIIIDLTNVPVSDCIERDAHRPNSVGANIIEAMARKYLQTDPPPSTS